MLLELLIEHEKPCFFRGLYQFFLCPVEVFLLAGSRLREKDHDFYSVYITLLYFKGYDPDSVKVFSMYLTVDAC